MSRILNFTIIDILKIERSVPNTIITHNKFCHVLSCRINGECAFESEAKMFVAKRGDVVFIPSSTDYMQKYTNETVIAFHIYTEEPIVSDIQIYKCNELEKIIDLFQKAESIWNKHTSLYKYACQSILYEITSRTGAMVKYEHNIIPQPLNDAINYINSHLFDLDFSIEKCLTKINISRTYFNKLFKSHFNDTPINYVNKKRINRAKQLLKTENYTNDIIANCCGFREIEYFYHVFKKSTGITPKEYKNKSLNNKFE